MFSVPCGLLLLALLAGAHAEKCAYASYGTKHGEYPMRFAYVEFSERWIELRLPFEESGCMRPVGAWVKVCVDDHARPDVYFYDVRTFHIERHGYREGKMRVTSGGFCSYPPVHAHGLGAASYAPKEVHLKGKN